MSTAVFFSFEGTRRRMYAGPLGPHIDELIAWLQGQHYTQHSTRCKIRVIADFSRWLSRHQWGADAADPERVQRYLRHRRRTSRCTMGDLSALRQMADMLLTKKVTRRAAASLSGRERIELDFCGHFLQDQGLRSSTPACYVRHVSRFLRDRFGDGLMCFDKLSSADVIEFIRRDTVGRAYYRAQQTLTAMKSFLRYLEQLAAVREVSFHYQDAHTPRTQTVLSTTDEEQNKILAASWLVAHDPSHSYAGVAYALVSGGNATRKYWRFGSCKLEATS